MQDSINLTICMYVVMGRKDVIDAILKSSGNMFLDDLMSLLSEESGNLQRQDVSCYTICCNQYGIDVL